MFIKQRRKGSECCARILGVTVSVPETERARWELPTFSSLQGPDVSFQFVDGLHVLVVLDTVKDDSATSLQVDISLLEHHSPDGNTGVHIPAREVKAADGTSIDSSAFLL